MLYHVSTAGITQKDEVDAPPPKWDLKLKFKQTELSYAANMNQQRAALIQFYFPWDFEDREIVSKAEVVGPGEAWTWASRGALSSHPSCLFGHILTAPSRANYVNMRLLLSSVSLSKACGFASPLR